MYFKKMHFSMGAVNRMRQEQRVWNCFVELWPWTHYWYVNKHLFITLLLLLIFENLDYRNSRLSKILISKIQIFGYFRDNHVFFTHCWYFFQSVSSIIIKKKVDTTQQLAKNKLLVRLVQPEQTKNNKSRLSKIGPKWSFLAES